MVRIVFVGMILFSIGMCEGADRFRQDRFCISFWVDPPADADMDARYAEIAGANFTVVLGGFGAKSSEQVERQIKLCKKYGMAAVVASEGVEAKDLPSDKACWGYMLKDEPNAGDFPKLAKRVKEIRQARPGKLAYINLFPNYYLI